METPDYYKKLKLYNWKGIYYYNNEPCYKTDKEPMGEIIDKIDDYPAGCYEVYSNGVIKCKTISGTFNITQPPLNQK